MNKTKLMSAALAIAIGATLGACSYTEAPKKATPSEPSVTMIAQAPFTVTTTKIEGSSGYVTRLVDQETGAVCYTLMDTLMDAFRWNSNLSCTQDIRAQAAVPEDATYTTLSQQEVEWVFNGNETKK